MANKVFRCDKFVDFLKANPTISAAIPWWILFGEPIRDDTQNNTQKPTYLIVRIVSDDGDDLNKVARIELRLVASRLAVPADLIDIFETINSELIKKCGGIVQLSNSFTTHSIDEATMYWPDYDTLNRLVMYKDYLIYYLTDQ